MSSQKDKSRLLFSLNYCKSFISLVKVLAERIEILYTDQPKGDMKSISRPTADDLGLKHSCGGPNSS